MTKKPSSKKVFTEHCRALIAEAVNGKPSASSEPADVREIVYGIAFLVQITKQYVEEHQFQGDKILATGALDAQSFIAALLNGENSKLFDFVEGARPPGRPKPSRREMEARAAAVACVEALTTLEPGRRRKDNSSSKARTDVASSLSGHGREITPKMLARWEEHFRNVERESVERLKSAFMRGVQPTRERIISRCVLTFYENTQTPV